MRIGIIAEDDGDVAVLSILAARMVRSKAVGFDRFIGRGAGKLRRKCGAWADILVRKGCQWVVVAHDRDANNEGELRKQLECAIKGCGAKASIVLIPVRELEAWLLFDSMAIARAFRSNKRPRLPGSPESLADPKHALEQIVWKAFRQHYVSTIHNERIARQLDVKYLNGARSFRAYPPFVERIRATLR